MSDFNQQIIEEFRANNGVVGGPFAGATMLLLTTTGAKSGQPRTTPLVCMPDGERIIIIASKGGAPTNPDWYYNLQANPVATVEMGSEQFQVRSTVIEGPERDQLYAKVVERMPGFGEYQRNTTRVIPILALERVA